MIYQVGGQYRSEATGLSCYYSYSGDLDDLSGYLAMGESTAFKNLYTYALTGQPEDQDYVSSLGIDSLPQLRTLADTDWDGAPLDVDENGTAFLTLGPDARTPVWPRFLPVLCGRGKRPDDGCWAPTTNMNADWDNGVFYDNFRGVWGAIDGHLDLYGAVLRR